MRRMLFASVLLLPVGCIYYAPTPGYWGRSGGYYVSAPTAVAPPASLETVERAEAEESGQKETVSAPESTTTRAFPAPPPAAPYPPSTRRARPYHSGPGTPVYRVPQGRTAPPLDLDGNWISVGIGTTCSGVGGVLEHVWSQKSIFVGAGFGVDEVGLTAGVRIYRPVTTWHGSSDWMYIELAGVPVPYYEEDAYGEVQRGQVGGVSMVVGFRSDFGGTCFTIGIGAAVARAPKDWEDEYVAFIAGEISIGIKL